MLRAFIDAGFGFGGRKMIMTHKRGVAIPGLVELMESLQQEKLHLLRVISYFQHVFYSL